MLQAKNLHLLLRFNYTATVKIQRASQARVGTNILCQVQGFWFEALEFALA